MPFRRAAATGIEPVVCSLTGSRLTIRPHRNAISVDRFQLSISCAQTKPALRRFGARGFPNFPTRCFVSFIANLRSWNQWTSTRERKSTQRESNPHFRHGEPAGYRYIMGANVLIGLSKSRFESTGPRLFVAVLGLEPTSPHYGCGILAAERPVPVFEWDQRDLNPHFPGKNRECCR